MRCRSFNHNIKREVLIMTLTEMGITGSIEAPETSEQREQVVLESAAIQKFLENRRPIGLIGADRVEEFVVTPEYGPAEKELFLRLGKLANLHIGLGNRSKIIKEDETDKGDLVYSLLSPRNKLGVCSVKSIIRVDSSFLVGHSHRLRSRGDIRREDSLASLTVHDANEFNAAGYRAFRLTS